MNTYESPALSRSWVHRGSKPVHSWWLKLLAVEAGSCLLCVGRLSPSLYCLTTAVCSSVSNTCRNDPRPLTPDLQTQQLPCLMTCTELGIPLRSWGRQIGHAVIWEIIRSTGAQLLISCPEFTHTTQQPTRVKCNTHIVSLIQLSSSVTVGNPISLCPLAACILTLPVYKSHTHTHTLAKRSIHMTTHAHRAETCA